MYTVVDGDAPDGMTAVDPMIAAASTAVMERPDVDEGGATMTYTSGTTGSPRVRSGGRSTGGHSTDAAHRLPTRGPDAQAGPDATGEVFVRSTAVFAGYYEQHDKFDEDHRDGFQTVGDIAYRDDEGFLHICDRKKDMIISGKILKRDLRKPYWEGRTANV